MAAQVEPREGWQPVTLAYLRYHWGGAYRFGRRGREYYGERLDGAGELTAPDLEALRLAVHEDYAARPVRGQP